MGANRLAAEREKPKKQPHNPKLQRGKEAKCLTFGIGTESRPNRIYDRKNRRLKGTGGVHGGKEKQTTPPIVKNHQKLDPRGKNGTQVHQKKLRGRVNSS